MSAFTRLVWKVLEIAVLTAFVAMLTLVIAQVFFRYVLAVSVPWTEEAARWFYAWQIFLGSAIATKEGLHLRADFLLQRFPARIKACVDFVISLAGLVFLAGIIWGSLLMMRAVYPVEAGSFPVSTSYLYLSIPVSLTVMVYLTAKGVIRDWRTLFGRLQG